MALPDFDVIATEQQQAQQVKQMLIMRSSLKQKLALVDAQLEGMNPAIVSAVIAQMQQTGELVISAPK